MEHKPLTEEQRKALIKGIGELNEIGQHIEQRRIEEHHGLLRDVRQLKEYVAQLQTHVLQLQEQMLKKGGGGDD